MYNTKYSHNTNRYPPIVGYPTTTTTASSAAETKSIYANKVRTLSSPPTSPTYIEERESYYTETGEKKFKVIRKYLKGKLLGKGGFAQCFEFTSSNSGNIYAAKVVDKKSLQKEKTKQKLISEIKIHKSLDHKGIVKFERYFEDKNNVYILLEICNCKVCILYSV
jgi:polo-like kinase 1